MTLHFPGKIVSYVLFALFAIIVFVLAFAPVGAGGRQSASASAPVAPVSLDLRRLAVIQPTDTPTPGPTPERCSGAFHYLKPHPGGPENGGVVTLGQQFHLDMMIHTDDYYVTAHQAYITFTSSVLRNVSTYVPGGCALNTAVTLDNTVFDYELQNEVCNGTGPHADQPCVFRGIINQPGDFAFASGAWVNSGSAGPDFRVAEMAFCVAEPGVAIIHWQFMPPDPENRNTMIVAPSGDAISNPDCYKDYAINAINPVVTPGFTEIVLPTRTRTPTSTVTPTPTDTPTPTITYTPTITDTPTPRRTATPLNTPCVFNLADVRPADYFYAAVRYMYCNGIISGYADHTFKPYQETTRAQLCKIVALAEGWKINNVYQPRFSDVPPGYPFFAYIMAAYSHDVISGYSDGTFQPGNSVTRAQLSKIIMRAQGWSVDDTGGPHFADVLPTDAFYPYIETVYNRGVISGYADRRFRPSNPATRGQISKIVYNAIGQR